MLKYFKLFLLGLIVFTSCKPEEIAEEDKVFVKWSVGDHGRNEDLQDLEKDYLNISKLK